MKYYTICFPGEYDQNVVETWSEDQIIQSYYKYWSTKMIENVKNPDLSRERCIEDWRMVHWAVETDKWGNKVDFEAAPLEEAIEFERKRNRE